MISVNQTYYGPSSFPSSDKGYSFDKTGAIFTWEFVYCLKLKLAQPVVNLVDGGQNGKCLELVGYRNMKSTVKVHNSCFEHEQLSQ